MHLKNFLISLAIGSFIGCASTPVIHQRIPRCLTDPGNNALQCDGVQVPFSGAYDYVCNKLTDDAELLRCR